MSFAVIEYTSKTGAIWRHTAARPNYLADPAHEIDPTSFGCYVSALAGEHIPLTLLIQSTRILNRFYRKFTGSWPSHYDLSYLAKFDRVLVVYDVAHGPTLTTFVRRLRRQYPATKIIGVPTQPYGLLRAQWQRDPQQKQVLQSFITSCDAFITIVKSTSSAWQNIFSHPVPYLPQPYPVEYAASFFQPLTHKKPIIFVSGVTDRPRITTGHQVAAKLQQQFADHVIHVTRTPDLPLDLSHLAGTNFTVRPFLPWRDQLRYLASVKLVINTDFTQTRGRVQMDCAAVGTPSVGADSDAQLDLFPRQAATARTAVADLIASAASLLTDANNYRRAVSAAAARLPFYNYPRSAARINQFYSTLKND